MIARVTCLTLALLCVAAPVRAQIIRVPRSAEPRVWTSLGASFYQMDGIVDGSSDSVWDLEVNSGIQYRGAIEWGIRNQTSLGVTGTYVSLPFRYYARSAETPPETSCNGCGADVNISSLVLSLHVGGGPGLHQVIEAQAGVTRFADFRADDGRELAPLDGDSDASLAVGYGIGYSFSNRLQVTVVQDFGVLFHQRTGLSSGEGSTIQQRVTRLGLRYGLFRQRPGV